MTGAFFVWDRQKKVYKKKKKLALFNKKYFIFRKNRDLLFFSKNHLDIYNIFRKIAIINLNANVYEN